MGLNKVTIDFVDHSISLINEYSKAFGRDENIKFNVGDILKNLKKAVLDGKVENNFDNCKKFVLMSEKNNKKQIN